MNYRELKALAHRADRARGEKRKRLMEKLMRELPTLDPLEGFSEEHNIWAVGDEQEAKAYGNYRKLEG